MNTATALPTATDETLKAFEALSATTVVDAMYQLGLAEGALAPEIRHAAGPKIVGRARTIDRIVLPRNAGQAEIAPALGLALYEVLDALQDGDVVVIAAQGDASYSTFGDNMALRSKLAGARGIVTDAAVRDTVEIGDLGFGAYAGGVSLRPGQFRFATVSVGQPVVIGGVRIAPGDVILADIDGVVAIPAARAAEVAERAALITKAESDKQASLRAGMGIVEAVKTYKIR